MITHVWVMTCRRESPRVFLSKRDAEVALMEMVKNKSSIYSELFCYYDVGNEVVYRATYLNDKKELDETYFRIVNKWIEKY